MNSNARRWIAAGLALAMSTTATATSTAQIAKTPAKSDGTKPAPAATDSRQQPQRPPSPFGGVLNGLRMRLEGGGMFGGRGRGGPGGGGPAEMPTSINGDLLDYPTIQKEIKLTKKQEIAVKKIKDESSTKSREIRSQFRPQRGDRNNNGQNQQNVDPQARAAQFAQMGEAMRMLNEATESEIGRVLTPDQRKRLFQITLQIQGAPASIRPDMIQRLGLSEEQVGFIVEILDQLNQARREVFQSMRGMFGGRGGRGGNNGQDPGNNAPAPSLAERDAAVKKMIDLNDKLRSSANKEIGGVLDAEQRKLFTKMMGKPFDLQALDADTSTNQNQRGGFGGPGGGPGGPGGGPGGPVGGRPARGGNAQTKPAPPPTDDE
ncbi:MAG: hypothetical protein NVSMB14_02940 [Isosphaeraceae bacterium]